jgi:hypothetical protein
MTEEHKDLNKFLRESYGKTVTGKTNFRLVWSEDIFEKRLGEFNEFYGKIFLRTIKGIRELRKYNYIHNRYILEGWIDGDLSSNGEVPEATHGDYAPIWVFEDNKNNPLTVTRKVLSFIIASIQGRVKRDDEIDEKTLEDLEIARTIESFDDHPADFSTSGPTRNAIGYNKGLKNAI